VALPAVTLMQPTLVATPFHREGWVYEEKYDGWRMLAYKREGQVQLVSRPGRDHTRRFPALVAAIAALRPVALVLDGEGRRRAPQLPAERIQRTV
jgi:bifunctional non-homologous end joining protein LigD